MDIGKLVKVLENRKIQSAKGEKVIVLNSREPATYVISKIFLNIFPSWELS